MMFNLRHEMEQRDIELRATTLPETKFDGATGRFLYGQLCLVAEDQANIDSERMTAMLRGVTSEAVIEVTRPSGTGA